MSGERVLLVRRGGGLWGVRHDEVATVTSGRDGFRVWLREGQLSADEILGVVDDLRVWPAGGLLARLWGERPGGLAVHGTTPLILIDPHRPPAILCPPTGAPDEAGGPETQTSETSDGNDRPDPH